MLRRRKRVPERRHCVGEFRNNAEEENDYSPFSSSQFSKLVLTEYKNISSKRDPPRLLHSIIKYYGNMRIAD
jgi:hypothetical protein